jgi:hypothetical protein
LVEAQFQRPLPQALADVATDVTVSGIALHMFLRSHLLQAPPSPKPLRSALPNPALRRHWHAPCSFGAGARVGRQVGTCQNVLHNLCPGSPRSSGAAWRSFSVWGQPLSLSAGSQMRLAQRSSGRSGPGSPPPSPATLGPIESGQTLNGRLRSHTLTSAQDIAKPRVQFHP